MKKTFNAGDLVRWEDQVGVVLEVYRSESGKGLCRVRFVGRTVGVRPLDEEWLVPSTRSEVDAMVERQLLANIAYIRESLEDIDHTPRATSVLNIARFAVTLWGTIANVVRGVMQ